MRFCQTEQVTPALNGKQALFNIKQLLTDINAVPHRTPRRGTSAMVEIRLLSNGKIAVAEIKKSKCAFFELCH
jgi:hypothetical protein